MGSLYNTVQKGLLALTLLAGPAFAHDFWLEPLTFLPDTGSVLPVRLRVGHPFKGEAYARNPRHLDRFVVLAAGGEKPVHGITGDEPAGMFRVEAPGCLVVGYRSKPAVIALSAAKFKAYLQEEGLTELPHIRAQNRTSEAPVREAFSRCAKAILQAGPGGGFDRTLGFPLELVPEHNPYTLYPGQALPVRILYRKHPLAGVRITAINNTDPHHTVEAWSDAEGRVHLPLDRGGTWLVKSVYLVPVAQSQNADWESFWASLTFQVPNR